MPKISTVELFCCDKFEETPKQKVIDLSKFKKFYFTIGEISFLEPHGMYYSDFRAIMAYLKNSLRSCFKLKPGIIFSLHGNRISSRFYTAHIENSYKFILQGTVDRVVFQLTAKLV